MDNNNQVQDAMNDPKVVGETTEANTKTVEEVEKEWKERYYSKVWKLHKEADEWKEKYEQVISSKSTPNTQSSDDQDIDDYRRIAKEEAEKAFQRIAQTEKVERERQAFLKSNPNAYDMLDEIQDVRDKFPTWSYERAYRFLNFDQPSNQPKEPSPNISTKSRGDTTPSNKKETAAEIKARIISESEGN